MYVIVSAPESFLLKRRRDSDAKRIQHPGVYQLRGVLTFVDGTTYEHEGVLDLLDIGLKTDTGSRQARVGVSQSGSGATARAIRSGAI